jgi:hypothetical protein
MKFRELDDNQKEKLYIQLTEIVESMGGKGKFFSMKDEFKEQKNHILLNKSANGYYGDGKIKWGKGIYKDTLELLYQAMKREEKSGDMIDGVSPKEYKAIMNMMRTLKPIEISIEPKNEENSGFSFSILDTTEEKKTKVDMVFKIVFFYSSAFAKDVLNYKKD